MRHTFIKAAPLLMLTLAASTAFADDRDAFSAKPAPPNIMWMVDNSGSMDNLPCSEFPEGTCFSSTDRLLRTETVTDATLGTVGTSVSICRSTFIDSLGYNRATTYPLPDPDFPTLYDVNKIYEKDNWGTTSTDVTSYCSAFACKQKARCVYSMKKYGYFYERSGCNSTTQPTTACANTTANNTNATSNIMMQGNLLRLYPPKFVGARRAVKDVLAEAALDPNMARQRVGLFFYNTTTEGGSLQKKMGPACADLCTSAACATKFQASRDAIKNRINTMAFSTNTPLGETLDSIGCYFGGSSPPRTCSFRTDQAVTTDSASVPICLSCQTNFAILLTDGLPTSDTTAPLSQASGSSDPQGYILPGVASYLFQTDLNTTLAGIQNVVTYTVSFGQTDINDTSRCAGVLERAALAGGGKCFPARNREDLKDALSAIIIEIDQRARSFTSPAVQATRAQGEDNANLAVFKPFGRGPLWEGHIFSFKLYDEVTAGTQYTNGNAGDAKELFVLDANDNKVEFDNEGNLLSKPYWDAALCLAGDLDNIRSAQTPTDPFNLDVSGCARRANEGHARARKMLTKFNPLVGAGATPDNFTVANVASLAPLMGLTGLTNSSTKVIRFFRGFDMLNDVSNGIVGATGSVIINGLTYARPIERSLSTYGSKSGWWKMGDVYHSTPGIVFAGGDLRGSPTYSPGANSAYDTYFTNIKPRKRVIIAGANDGFIHAFDAGTPVTGSDPIIYSKGNGEELWAYAPSHLLPKMGSAIVCPNDVNSACEVSSTKYNYYVDGSPMIRDAYLATGTSDRGNTTTFTSSAYADRWKTVMVVGDRDGGNRFTALDVTDPVAPKFLWEFPTTISAAANGRAEPAALSWSDVFPNPAPILPVVFDGDGNLTTTADRYTRFVVLLNGGFSRNQTGGRGVYMVDARDGTLLWKYEYSTVDAEHQAMRYSFAAPVAGIPYPITSKTTTMAVAVDTGGQVWQFDFTDPGVIPVGGLAQWTGKRIFTTAIASATTQAYGALPDANTAITAAEYPYRGMYSLVAAGYVYSEVETGGLDLWTYVGTGDRDLVGNPNVAHTSGVSLDSAIVDASCGRAPYDGYKYVNRFYGINLSKGRSNPSQPNSENDLSPLNTQSAYGEVQTLGQPTTYGWYLMLRPGEKVNNAAYLFNRGVYFTTYQPTGSCLATGSSTIDSCESPSGVGRLYALDYLNGRPIIDFNSGGGGVNFGNIKGVTTTSSDTSLALGAGLPTTSAVTVAVGNGKQSAAMLLSTSNDPTPKAQRAMANSTLVRKVWSLLVSEDLHGKLPGFGSQH